MSDERADIVVRFVPIATTLFALSATGVRSTASGRAGWPSPRPHLSPPRLLARRSHARGRARAVARPCASSNG
jgi:hypothetical protein